MSFTVYRAGAVDSFPQASYHPSIRCTNQIELVGTNPVVELTNGIFWIENIVTADGVNVAIADGKGKAIVPVIGTFDTSWSPIRCDFGIQVTGTVLLIKGFIQEACLG